MTVRALCAPDTGWLKWGCSSCGREEQSAPEMDEAERQHIRNCLGDACASAAFARCPWSQIGDAESALIAWWVSWRTLGSLPYRGSMADQPAYVAEALELCEIEANSIQSAEAKREMERAKAEVETAKGRR
jgi:hypothetical protein